MKGLFTFSRAFWWRSYMVRNATSGHQRTPADTSGHQRTPADTSGHQRTPAATSSHQRTPADTSGQQQPPADTSSHQQPPAATSGHQRTRPPPGHISQPDGVPGGHVPRSEARGFHRESGKNLLFQLQIIRLLFSFEGNTKKATGFRPIAFIYFMYCPFYIRFLLLSLLKIKNL